MIRHANENDLSDILTIYNEAILNTTAIYSYKPHSLSDRVIWYQSKLREGYPLLVSEEEGKVVAFASYGSFRPYPAFKYTIEHSIYVDKNYRNMGHASRLLRELIQIANENGYATMVGVIDSSNEGSIHMHEKMGFRFSGKIDKAGYKFGRWLDLVFFQLDLLGPASPLEE